MLLNLLKYFEDLCYVELGKLNTDQVEIELKPDAKTTSSRYYQVPHMNKWTFWKKLASLIKISILTLVQQSEYGTPVFIISNKEVTVTVLTNFCQVNNTIVQNIILPQELVIRCNN